MREKSSHIWLRVCGVIGMPACVSSVVNPLSIRVSTVGLSSIESGSHRRGMGQFFISTGVRGPVQPSPVIWLYGALMAARRFLFSCIMSDVDSIVKQFVYMTGRQVPAGRRLVNGLLDCYVAPKGGAQLYVAFIDFAVHLVSLAA